MILGHCIQYIFDFNDIPIIKRFWTTGTESISSIEIYLPAKDSHVLDMVCKQY